MSSFDLSETVGKRVVRLPTAARRQVKQSCNKRWREACQDLRRQHAPRFNYEPPWRRKAMSLAERLAKVERSPELCILLAIVGTMDRDQRTRIMMSVNKMAERTPESESAQTAASLIAATILTYGEQGDLNNALDTLQGERKPGD